jgi:hypothetical protein
MKTTRPLGILIVSILLVGAGTLSAQDEPGPFERFFRAMRRAVNEPQHRSTSHRSKPKQTQDTGNPTATTDESNTAASTSSSSSSGGGSVGKPPNDKNTRGTSKAVTKKGEDLPYGTPVAGKKGFVTSPFSPNSGYIDVRGFAPGTPVKDPYTGKVFLTP